MWRAKDENGVPQDWCTVFGDRMLKINMSGACKEHDMDYAARTGKVFADLEFAGNIFRSGKRAIIKSFQEKKYLRLIGQVIMTPILIIGALAVLNAFGWIFYYDLIGKAKRFFSK